MSIKMLLIGVLLLPMAIQQGEENFNWPDLAVDNIVLNEQCQIMITIRNDNGYIKPEWHRECAVKVNYEGSSEEFYMGMPSSLGKPAIDSQGVLVRPNTKLTFNTGIKLISKSNVMVTVNSNGKVKESNTNNNTLSRHLK